VTAETATDIEKLRAEMTQLRGEISQIGETLKAIAADRGAAAYERVRQSGEALQQQAKDAIDSAAREIEQRPFTTVLSAFGIGLLLGALLGRRA
jgi:ElaB/YqjD/DUF883 family membrane-anchored ribosome-binding protein